MRHHFEISARRIRTPFAEVDLLVFDARKNNFILVEVKSDFSEGLDGSVSRVQRRRLRAASEFLGSLLGVPMLSLLAVVTPDQKIHWYPDFLQF